MFLVFLFIIIIIASSSLFFMFLYIFYFYYFFQNTFSHTHTHSILPLPPPLVSPAGWWCGGGGRHDRPSPGYHAGGDGRGGGTGKTSTPSRISSHHSCCTYHRYQGCGAGECACVRVYMCVCVCGVACAHTRSLPHPPFLLRVCAL